MKIERIIVMFKGFFKVDKSMGEDIYSRPLGILLLLAIIVFSILKIYNL